jgi:hypothetical protein
VWFQGEPRPGGDTHPPPCGETKKKKKGRFSRRRYGTDLQFDCSPRSGTYHDGKFDLLRRCPPYLVVDSDNFTASPLAGSFMRTVGKILVSMRQWLWERKRSETYNPGPKCKAMPTPVGVWWAFAKKPAPITKGYLKSET